MLQNPANLSGTGRKWDVNLVSFDIKAATDAVTITPKGLNKAINEFTEKGKIAFSGNVNLDVVGPSFSFNINPKHAIAVTTRGRAFISVDNFDAKFVQTLIADADKITGLPHMLSIPNQSLNGNLFYEIGASYGGEIFEMGNHTLRAGATVKYVMGVGNSRIGLNNINGVIYQNPLRQYEALLTAFGEAEVVNSGVSVLDFQPEDLLKASTTGVGFDLGVVYEYRDNPDDDRYRLKAGFAVTDIGSLKYTPVKNEAHQYSLNGATINPTNIIKELEENTQITQNAAITDSYHVSLPTAIRSQLDYRIYGNIFVELGALYGISKDKNKAHIPAYVSEVSLTPRFENRYFGAYLPLSYNYLTEYNAGLALRLGPLFVGSSSLFTALAEKSKQMDVFVGLRFGR